MNKTISKKEEQEVRAKLYLSGTEYDDLWEEWKEDIIKVHNLSKENNAYSYCLESDLQNEEEFLEECNKKLIVINNYNGVILYRIENKIEGNKLIIDDESEQMAVIDSDSNIILLKHFGDKDINYVLDYLLEYDTLNENESIKDIDYCLQNKIIPSDKIEYQAFRVCSECNKIMFSGYVIKDGEEYYCSDQCLHKHYTEDEYLKLHKENEDENCQAYWTEWE